MKELAADPKFVDGVMRCVRCSICTAGCPSYSVFKTEGDSPRGRVQLMRSAALGTLAADARFEQHMDNCLGCRACEDVCPSGVPFGYLIDRTHRALLATDRHRTRKLATRVGLRLLANRTAVRIFAMLLGFVQLLRLDRLARMVVAPFSRSLARRIDTIPRVSGLPFDFDAAPQASEPEVHMFGGCIMAGALGDVQRATVAALEAEPLRVATPPAQRCCGALHQHAGLLDEARALARANIDAFGDSDEPICVSSAGCALAMKGYPTLLASAGVPDERAVRFARRVRDLSQLVTKPAVPARVRVAVQDACHHRNIQRQGGEVAALLARAGADVVQLPKGAGCCGSAGLYSTLNPEPAWQLLDPLLDAVERSGCEIVIASNPGCLMFMRAGLRARGSEIRVLHLAEFLAPER